MPAIKRPPWHNTYLYSSTDRETMLRSLWAAPSVTNTNFYSMVEIVCTFTDIFELRNGGGELVERDGGQLLPGNYYIVTNGSITVSNAVPLTRTMSTKSGKRCDAFREAVRARDGGCVITDSVAVLAHIGDWDTFQAAHIVPIAYEGYWEDQKFGDLITVQPIKESHGTINSLQNGILLRCDVHLLFDNYKLTINPDDNYKIMCFSPDASRYAIAGRQPNQAFLNNPHRPPDGLLRWHFQQTVLANMK